MFDLLFPYEVENVSKETTSLIVSVQLDGFHFKDILKYVKRTTENGDTALMEAAKMLNMELIEQLHEEIGMSNDY